MAVTYKQAFLTGNDQWTITIDRQWDVLGPFPIHAREQHFLSPAFPLDLSQAIDYNQTWPSSYADNGIIKWTTTTSTENGDLEISFPDIRWSNLRSTEGWAALQHHAVLRTTLTLHAPSKPSEIFPQVLVNIKQGSYFTLRPRSFTQCFTPKWYAGNIYDIPNGLAQVVDLPTSPSLDQPSEYDLFISGDYEIRLFGDPLSHNSNIPVQTINVDLQTREVKENKPTLVHAESLDVVCDFVSGYAFGHAIGIGIQSISGWWTVESVALKSEIAGMGLQLKQNTTIASTQSRTIPIFIEQSQPYHGNVVEVEITLAAGPVIKRITASIPVIQKVFDTQGHQWVQGTFFFAGSMPSPFRAIIPATNQNLDAKNVLPILALHGAGVDIIQQDFWINALPNNWASWIVVPTGRTSWGLDWHGPSSEDAWASLAALVSISQQSKYKFPSSWKMQFNTKAIIVGHSNGGQGTWYLASRHPDRVVAAIPAAGYIKSQSYVPLTLARSGHFVDPSLRAILESSLTPDDNDLHITNLANAPVLAIHGGDDRNVPAWHSRESVSVIKTWNPSANITYKEDAGEDHWYPNVFVNPQVQKFLNEVQLYAESRNNYDFETFTLTVTIPWQSGSLHGWSIDQLVTPGRLGRLTVRKLSVSQYSIETSNVLVFTMPAQPQQYEIIIDDEATITSIANESTEIRQIATNEWATTEDLANLPRPSVRLQSILSTAGPLRIIVPDLREAKALSAALRVAHVLNLYHKLDADITDEETAFTWKNSDSWPLGNVVFIGTPSSKFAQEILKGKEADVRIEKSTPYIGTRKFNKLGQALLFTHPHPVDKEAIMMFILYNDEAGLERSLRLFPFRTGVPAPDWLVVGEKMDKFAAGGIEGAGVWGNNWTLDKAMTWFSR